MIVTPTAEKSEPENPGVTPWEWVYETARPGLPGATYQRREIRNGETVTTEWRDRYGDTVAAPTVELTTGRRMYSHNLDVVVPPGEARYVRVAGVNQLEAEMTTRDPVQYGHPNESGNATLTKLSSIRIAEGVSTPTYSSGPLQEADIAPTDFRVISLLGSPAILRIKVLAYNTAVSPIAIATQTVTFTETNPAHLTAIKVGADDGIRVTASGFSPMADIFVLASTDMVTWVNVHAGVADASGNVTWDDVTQERRFYRVVTA